MKKRLLSGLLAAVLVLGLAPAALAAAPAEDEAAQVLAALDIMVGDSDGNLELGRAVTRAEFTKMAVAASTSRDAVGDTVPVKPYPDVPQTYWAAPWIKAAVDLGLVQGDLRGYFNPTQTITLAEGVTIVLRLLGYPDSAFTGVWPSGQMAQYKALKLNEGVSCAANDAMTRRDALYLFYNAGPGGPCQLRHGGPRGGRERLAEPGALRRERRQGLPLREPVRPVRHPGSGRGVLVQIHAHRLGLYQSGHRHLSGGLALRVGPHGGDGGGEELRHRDRFRRLCPV